MTNSKRILKVPEDSTLRNQLREASYRLALQLNLLPPTPFEQLEQLATNLVTQLGISEDYIDFTMVLLGNESWRKIVAATPFNRRLLLLPQCLKDNVRCKGVFDALGLNCAACKACPVDDILLEAEKLGYATLVAEGTTVAIGLVEEGSIDAVIGVSCMPVLQRSFEPVSNAAVPVIGLPLMYDGCENTKIDLPWLYNEVRYFNPDSLWQPISISAIKNKVSVFFEQSPLDEYFGENHYTEHIAKEYLQIGGQRLRPIIAALSYVAYSDCVSDTVFYPLALIVECFHKASLIHDDIEDNADLRYRIPTAHIKYGMAQAINTGDYLIGKGYELLTQLPVKHAVIVKCLKRISESHLKLTQGQGADLLVRQGLYKPGLAEIIKIFENKTGEAIKVALLLGAILGDADDSELQILHKFADLFGVAYQIRDDLNEYKAAEPDEQISDFPFLMALLHDAIGEQAYTNTANFRLKVSEQAADQKAGEILSGYIQRCYATLDELSNQKLRLSLYSLLGKIFKNSKI